MRILQVYPYFAPAWGFGGVTRVVYEISKGLVRRGHEVTVYATDALNPRSRIHVDSNPIWLDGIKVYYFKNISNCLASKYHVALPLGLFFKSKEIKKFDIIHLHGYRHLLNVVVAHYARKYGMPYLIHTHGSLLRMEEKKRVKRIFDVLCGYKVLRNAATAIALTETELKQYKKMGIHENKIVILPNGIDLTQYASLPQKGSFRKKYGINNEEKIVLYVGRLHESKGIDLLLKTFPRILKEFPNCSLVLVGPDDGYRNEAERIAKELKIENKVVFTGFISQNEKLAAFVDANVFVTPRFSGFPVSFLESCACGTPIVTTDYGDNLLWLDGNVGFVATCNYEDIAKKIITLLSDKTVYTKFSENCKQLVKDKFTWEKIIMAFEKVYTSTAKSI